MISVKPVSDSPEAQLPVNSDPKRLEAFQGVWRSLPPVNADLDPAVRNICRILGLSKPKPDDVKQAITHFSHKKAGVFDEVAIAKAMRGERDSQRIIMDNFQALIFFVVARRKSKKESPLSYNLSKGDNLAQFYEACQQGKKYNNVDTAKLEAIIGPITEASSLPNPTPEYTAIFDSNDNRKIQESLHEHFGLTDTVVPAELKLGEVILGWSKFTQRLAKRDFQPATLVRHFNTAIAPAKAFLKSIVNAFFARSKKPVAYINPEAAEAAKVRRANLATNLFRLHRHLEVRNFLEPKIESTSDDTTT